MAYEWRQRLWACVLDEVNPNLSNSSSVHGRQPNGSMSKKSISQLTQIQAAMASSIRLTGLTLHMTHGHHTRSFYTLTLS